MVCMCLKMYNPDQSQLVSSNLHPIPVVIMFTTINFTGTCPGYQCTNGYCISKDKRCDGQNDCPDGDDEQGCDMSKAKLIWKFKLCMKQVILWHVK